MTLMLIVAEVSKNWPRVGNLYICHVNWLTPSALIFWHVVLLVPISPLYRVWNLRHQRGMHLLYADYSRKQMSAHRLKICWDARQFVGRQCISKKALMRITYTYIYIYIYIYIYYIYIANYYYIYIYYYHYYYI